MTDFPIWGFELKKKGLQIRKNYLDKSPNHERECHGKGSHSILVPLSFGFQKLSGLLFPPGFFPYT